MWLTRVLPVEDKRKLQEELHARENGLLGVLTAQSVQDHEAFSHPTLAPKQGQKSITDQWP